MADDRFFHAEGPFTLAEIAARAQIKLPDGAPIERKFRGVAPLESAGVEDVSVFSDARLASSFATSHAGVIVTSAKLADLPHNGSHILVARDPRFAFAAIGLLFHPRGVDKPGIHETALIDSSAELGSGCQIDSGVVIGPGARIGDGSQISSHAVIGAGVVLGAGCTVGANAVISHALIGAGVRIGCGTVIGGEGFGVVLGPTGLMCSAQIGRVLIEDNVRIGGNCTIDRGALADTVIGRGTMIDNLVQIGHNVRIGSNCIFAGQAGVAGSVTIADNVMVGGQVAISDHLTVGTGARIAGKAGVMRDVAPGEAVAGYPAIPVRQWHRQNVFLGRSVQKTTPGA